MSFPLSFLALVTFLSVNCEPKSSYTINRTHAPNKSVNNLTILPFDLGVKVTSSGGLVKLSAQDRGKWCLKNVEECYENDLDYETSANHLSQFIFSRSPPFDLSQPGVSELCRNQSAKYVEDLKHFKLWALQMYDATAKLPSGLLNGNLNQFGDFDLCLKANEKSSGISGQYCLASLQIEAESSASPYLQALHRLTHAHYHFRSQLDDPAHRLPRFSSVNWALCVPSGCSSGDVEIGLKNSLSEIFGNSGLDFEVKLDSYMCQSEKKSGDIPTSTVVAGCFFGGMVFLVCFAAIYDYTALGDKNEWIMAFSLRENFNSIISLRRSSDDIQVIHGIRFLTAFLLLLSHKSLAVFFIPYINRTEMVEYLGRPWSVLGRAASLYTDPFIMFSGTLTTYSILKKLERNKRINVFEEYSSRLLRIVPTFAALIAFCTLVLPWLNSGPLWNQVVAHHSNICKKYWWRNLLFIHNYFGFGNMCLTHTHHIGIDTQLFFASPFLIYLIWKWPRKGSLILVTLATISTFMRYYVTYTMKLNNYIHFGTSIKQLFDTADNMYTLPVHRLTVYIMGILLGFILRNFKNLTLSKLQIRIGNAAALLSFFASFLGPAFMSCINYSYNPRDAAWYAAFAPILWCFSFCWIIFTSHLGHVNVFTRVFSLPVFTLWTKISYTVYLTQFPIFFYNVGTTRNSEHFEFFRVMFNIKEMLWIVAFSAGLTLVFEIPFQNVNHLVFSRKKAKIMCNNNNNNNSEQIKTKKIR